MVKAISLLSGGLDSILATKLILDEGVLVEAVTFWMPFVSSSAAVDISSQVSCEFNIKHHIIDLRDSVDYLKIVRKPTYGYGKNLNPCIDCHIFMLKKAKELMREKRASFIITGEVLGERPMSQRREILNLIDEKTSLKGLVVRPLSARLLEPTEPEMKGWLKRDDLLDIQGRSRRRQLDLAREMNIKHYLSPAGGCLLTDREFSKKVKDLIECGQLTIDNVALLKVGRHFRLDSEQKLVVGRDKSENKKIEGLRRDDDIILKPERIPGPTALYRGRFNLNLINLSGRILASYTKTKDIVRIRFYKRSNIVNYMEVKPLDREVLDKYRI